MTARHAGPGPDASDGAADDGIRARYHNFDVTRERFDHLCTFCEDVRDRAVVREGEVVIIDEFTGRMMTGRRYSDGLEISRANKRAGRPREWAHKPAPKGKWPFATMLAVS